MIHARLRRRHRARRGQGMVEFALVLPLLALLLVMTIDFGRVFFGWVALQNATRIGADRAAQTWQAWPTADNGEEELWRDEYQALITADLRAANCQYTTPHPEPTFTDVDGDGAIGFGDHATVNLNCSFGLLTPLAQNLFGGPINLAAESTFAVNGVVVMGVPDPPPPADPCSDPDASFTTDPPRGNGGRVNDTSNSVGSPANPFVVDFMANAESNQHCTITYRWEIDSVFAGDEQDLLDQEFTDAPGGGHTDYIVRLQVTNSDGESTTDQVRVRVTNP